MRIGQRGDGYITNGTRDDELFTKQRAMAGRDGCIISILVITD
jgi:hypothetical protein